MADIQNKHPENVPGIFYTDTQCINCDLCKLTAPDNFRPSTDGSCVVVFKQPSTPEEEALCMESMTGCPVDAIGNNGDGTDRSEENKRFAESAHLKHIEEMEARRAERLAKLTPEDDEDRVECPFCGTVHYPGSGTVDATDWTWEKPACEHLLFLALDISGYSGFQHRSKLFNEHLNLPDSDDGELMIPSKDDPEEYLSVSEIIDLVTLPGLELRGYEDPGGIACGPCGGGTVTFGFVPTKNN